MHICIYTYECIHHGRVWQGIYRSDAEGAYICICIYIYIYMCIYIYLYTYICTYIYIYIYVHMYVYTYVFTYAYLPIHACVREKERVCGCAYVNIHIYTCMYMYMPLTNEIRLEIFGSRDVSIFLMDLLGDGNSVYSRENSFEIW